MIRQISTFLLSVGVTSLALGADYSCHLGETFQSTTAFNVGPNVYASVQNNADVATSIGLARDVWDATDAVDRIGGWTNTVSSSDCPYNQSFQIGHFNFETTSCFTNALHGIDAYSDLAFVDWPKAGCGSLCGTYSVTVNTAFAWVANGSPNSGQFDLRSVLAHEFGHVLGLGHQFDGSCDTTTVSWCGINAGLDTMYKKTASGETCQASIETGDSTAMNYFYP